MASSLLFRSFPAHCVVLAGLLLLPFNAVLAAECSAIFANVAQNSGNKKVEIKTGAQLINTGDRVIATNDLIAHGTACDGQACLEGGSLVPAIDHNTFPSGASLDEDDSPLSPGDYKKLTVSDSNTLVFAPGEYTFKEDVDLGDDVTFTVSGPGTVRILVKKSFSTGSRFKVNESNTGDVFIFTREDITIGEDSRLNAVIYSKKKITLKRDSELNGALTAKEDIIIEEDSTVTFDPDLVSDLDFDEFCEGPVAPVALADSASVEVSGTVTVDLAANDTSGVGLDLSSLTITSSPANGSVVNNNDGTITYTHGGGANVSDSLSYEISDTDGAVSNVAVLSINVVVIASCEEVFPGGIQTHGFDGFISVHEKGSYDEPRILSSGTLINTVSIVDHDDNADPGTIFCGAGSTNCTANNTPSLSNGVVIAANTATDDVGTAQTLGADGSVNFRDIDIGNNGGDLIFTSETEFFIRDLSLGDNTSLTLTPGTYWIENDFYMGKNADLFLSGTGSVQIFVGGAVEFKEQNQINVGGGPDRLLIYSNSSGGEKFKMKKGVDAEGYFISQGSFEFKEESTLLGGLSGYSIDHLDWGAEITYQAPSADFSLFCESSSSAVHHYAISYDGGGSFDNAGAGLTCEAAPVTLVAHDELHNSLTPSSGTSIDLSTTPGSGVWFGDGDNTIAVGFDGSVTSRTLYLQQLTPATLNMNISGADQDANEDENIVFSDTGLFFYADGNADGNADDLDTNGVGDPIPNQVAGVTYTQAIVSARRTDEVTGSCVSALTANATLPVRLAYRCDNPTSCVNDNDLQVNGTPINENNLVDAIDYDGVSINLSFDAEGEAVFPFAYDDVGQIQLFGEVDVAATDEDPAFTLSGSSQSFVVRPYELSVHLVESAAGDSNPGTLGTGAGFVRAEEPFVIGVKALNSNGRETPNYGSEITAESVQVQAASIEFPSGATEGSLSNGQAFTHDGGGEFTNNTVEWSEVGTLKVRASVADGDYLGAGAVFLDSVSGNIGRFYPDHFELSEDSLGNACNDFTYMDQPAINVAYKLSAIGFQNGTLKNYDNTTLTGYTVATVAHSLENNNDGVDLIPRFSAATSTWVAGEYTLADGAAQFSRLAAGPDGTFSQLALGVVLSDALDARVLQSLDMNAGTADDCVAGASCSAAQVGSTFDVRYGRLVTADSFGSENAPLPVKFQTEYWNGSSFVINAEDSSAAPVSDGCTSVLRTRLLMGNDSPLVDTVADFVVDVGVNTSTGVFTSDATDVFFDAGSANLVFTAPQAVGSFSLQVVNVEAWLRHDWDQSGAADDNDLPVATISFGSYRGHDRIIYWREKLD